MQIEFINRQLLLTFKSEEIIDLNKNTIDVEFNRIKDRNLPSDVRFREYSSTGFKLRKINKLPLTSFVPKIITRLKGRTEDILLFNQEYDLYVVYSLLFFRVHYAIQGYELTKLEKQWLFIEKTKAAEERESSISDDETELDKDYEGSFHDFKPQRRIFDWGSYFDESISSQGNPKELKEKIERKIFQFFNYPGEYDDKKWGNHKHDFSIPITYHGQSIKIRRTRVCGSDLFKQRLFYCFGDQLNDPRFAPCDIILLYCSKPNEHDNYQKVARELGEMIVEKLGFNEIRERRKITTPSHFYEYIYSEKKNTFKKNAILTVKQQEILDKCLGNPPAIIYGAAGTGKTLMSEKLYKAIAESANEGKRILYLTFIEPLAEHVKNELEDMNVKGNIECLTYSKFVTNCFKTAYDYYKDDQYRTTVRIKNSRHLFSREEEYPREKDFQYFYKWITESPDTIFDNRNTGYGDVKLLKKYDVRLEYIDQNPYDAASIIYLFFRSLNNKRDYSSFAGEILDYNCPTYLNFKNALREEKDLDERTVRKMFTFCQAYEQHLKKYGFIDDNISSFILSDLFERNDCPIQKYDSIIIDEIQDLTIPQIDSLMRTVKNGRIFAYGDDNQSINPSLLKMREAKNHIYDYFGIERKGDEETKYLTEIMRSSQEVVEYINLLNNIRANSIAADKAYSQEPLVSRAPKTNKKSDKPAYMTNLVEFKNLMDDSDLFLNNEIGIITPNQASKNNIINRYLATNQKNIFTIEEIKGREREIIILYNFFSTSKDIWRKISEKYFEVNRQGKLYSTLYRRFFNRYYVGLTRAKKKVIVFEEEKLPDVIVNCFFKNKNNELEFIQNRKQLDEYFLNDFTHDRWYSGALEHFKVKDYSQAYDYIKNAIASYEKIKDTPGFKQEILDEYINKASEFEMYQLYSFVIDEGDGQYSDQAQLCSDYFLRQGLVDMAMNIYEKYYQDKYKVFKSVQTNTDKERTISLYKEVKGSLTETEQDYLGLKVINSYHEIIKKQLGGLTNGRQNN